MSGYQRNLAGLEYLALFIVVHLQNILENMLQFLRVFFVLGHEGLIQVVIVVAVIENLKQILLYLLRTQSTKQPAQFQQRGTFRSQKFPVFPLEILVHPVLN